jgi:hypothetical protein
MSAELILPSAKIMANAMKIACQQDKPIKMDYWIPSLNKKVIIVVNNSQEKRLFKSDDEYTSIFSKFFSCDDAYIILTGNSIYIVSNMIASKRYTVKQPDYDDDDE